MAELSKPAPKPAPKPTTPTGLTVGEQEALDNARDAEKRKKEDAAETTKKTMGDKLFAKGGSIRGGGCETKGKTKGRMV